MDIPDEYEQDTDGTDEPVDPDHPASTVQCDHHECSNPSPGRRRICESCDTIMKASMPDECRYCGVSIRD